MNQPHQRSNVPPAEKSAPGGLTNRQRFLEACHCRATDRPPVWLMRQAGRALPEYRALKEKHSFLELVQTPELAAEVTLQPVRRFGFDAAILFSDILVIPEAMGQAYRFRETGGMVLDFAVRNHADIEKLSVGQVCERLAYVDKALRLLRKELGDQTALIGFSGSPWTLATFMMEGGGAEKYTRALTLFRKDRESFNALAEKLTAAITAYLKMQIAAGVDALQIFDSHGGHLAAGEFQEASGRWMREIIARINSGRAGSPLPAVGAHGVTRPTSVPVIVFSLGTHGNWDDLINTGANVIGIDWQFSLANARRLLPANVALQGNLAPSVLSDATPEIVAGECRAVLEAMRGRPGHIFNLGHGLTPTAKLENITALVDTVKNFR
ncbi:MAG: uroporphyrinogen decarboxylase [Verrucomicrobia bacterium]|jgi:uroporphyrinogen decarboxylase|nr:uroporphyrinogen decarboxylase [Verrucomicrobiota bacterium]